MKVILLSEKKPVLEKNLSCSHSILNLDVQSSLHKQADDISKLLTCHTYGSRQVDRLIVVDSEDGFGEKVRSSTTCTVAYNMYKYKTEQKSIDLNMTASQTKLLCCVTNMTFATTMTQTYRYYLIRFNHIVHC